MLMVYDELHRLAANKLRHEKHRQTLNAIALVHEAYLKLVDQERVTWDNSRRLIHCKHLLWRQKEEHGLKTTRIDLYPI
jgi:hypothetical protein